MDWRGARIVPAVSRILPLRRNDLDGNAYRRDEAPSGGFQFRSRGGDNSAGDCVRDVAAGENAEYSQRNCSRVRGDAELAGTVFRVHRRTGGLEVAEQLARERQMVHFRDLLLAGGVRACRAASFRILNANFSPPVDRKSVV